jgi:hypothetical protein
MRQRALNIGAAVLLTVLSALAVDNALYWASPWLPAKIVAKLSPYAYARYLNANAETTDWDYRGAIRTLKPLRRASSDSRSGSSDEFGYRNPPGYTKGIAGVDVIVAGDSFAWGTEERTIADYLREMSAPLTVYSVGQPGTTLTQWSVHVENIAALSEKAAHPSVIILNYSAPHVINALLYEHRLKAYGLVGAEAFYAWRHVALTNDRVFRELRWRPFVLAEIRTIFHNLFAVRPAQASSSPHPACQEADCPEVSIRLESDVETEWPLLERALQSTSERMASRFPGVKIVLGYIPSSAAIWGEKLCAVCRGDIEVNRRNVRRLGALCERLGIVLADATGPLRDLAEINVPVWKVAHFSPRGYEVYSRVLANAISSLALKQSR